MSTATEVAQEVWETTTQRHMRFRKTDSKGREITFKVGGQKGRRFNISAEDRELNELLCFKPSQNAFRNGLLLPVKGSEVAKAAEDPNMLTDAEIIALLALEGNSFKSKIGKITAEATLRRIDEIAADLEEPLSKSKQETLTTALAPYEPITQIPSAIDTKDSDLKEIRLS
jgi:hypothetical protein